MELLLYLVYVFSVLTFLSKEINDGGRITLEAPYNALSVVLLEGLRLLRLAEFVRYNQAAIGGPSKRQSMNSFVSSCLCSTCYAQTPFARCWQAIKAAANEITPKLSHKPPRSSNWCIRIR